MTYQPFDSVADRYDQVFTDSGIGRLQRSAVHHYLDRRVFGNAPMSILELGCGTGEDATHFAENGHIVTATDISPSMLKLTDAKAEKYGLADQIRTVPLDLQDPNCSDLEGPFDLIFSNFGALNCIDEAGLQNLAEKLVPVTATGSHTVLVVMPRACLWETLYFLLRGRPRSAFRRLRGGPISAAVGQASVSTWYHSPQAVVRAFEPAFRRRGVVPVGFAVPPSFLEPWAGRNPRTLAALAKTDQILRQRGLLGSISDHALIHLERS
ncbi:MAG: hypothetical protein DRJ61_05240 [Acidobacteria bacterium]|nr:MAG: hypothetical protein DRJ61_05240 [Acidobacteriota bacterium]